jgi:hypothetical protein
MLFAVALRLFSPLDGVFSVALQKRRATAVKVKRRHLVAEMCTLQTDKPTEPSCPIRSEQHKHKIHFHEDRHALFQSCTVNDVS